MKKSKPIEVIKKPNSMITYYWNHETNAVTASIKMSDIENDIKSTVDKCFGYKTDWYDCYSNLDWTSKFCDFERGNHTITATSIPHGGDEFDLDTGMRLSREKVLYKYYRIKRKCLISMVIQLNDETKRFAEEANYATLRMNKFSSEMRSNNN